MADGGGFVGVNIIMSKVALSFLAHPDDAEFLCAGTLVRLADAGWEIHIATATAGDCGTVTHTSWQISSIRTQEASEAASLINATYHCLDEPDGMVVYDKPTVRKAIDLFRRVAPSLVFTHAPKDYMMDHEMVSKLARAASFLYGAPNASDFPLRADSAVPHLYYCDPVGNTDNFLKPIAATTLINITRQLEKKTQMLITHASQREWLQVHHGMDEYVEAMKRHGIQRGKEAGVDYAEGFIQHVGHPYPQSDLIAEICNS
jgi:LmbE family N-acetylglucosaminyl deacetylase